MQTMLYYVIYVTIILRQGRDENEVNEKKFITTNHLWLIQLQ